MADFVFGSHKHHFYYFGEMSSLVRHLFDEKDTLQLAQLYIEQIEHVDSSQYPESLLDSWLLWHDLGTPANESRRQVEEGT